MIRRARRPTTSATPHAIVKAAELTAPAGADDLGRTSSVERDFTLDLTLGTPATVSPALTVPRLRPRAVATFGLTRQARVTEQVETPKARYQKIMDDFQIIGRRNVLCRSDSRGLEESIAANLASRANLISLRGDHIEAQTVYSLI